LKRLEKHNPKQSKTVELRYFGGILIEEITAVVGISERSVRREWTLARLWLFRKLGESSKSHPED
jgi:DNA-directed RNA polymerase specialized sigma24 family protein